MPSPWYAPNVAKDEADAKVASPGGAHGRWKSAWGRIPDLHRRRIQALCTADIGVAIACAVLGGRDLDPLFWGPLATVLVAWVLLDLACSRGDPGAVAMRRVAAVPATIGLALVALSDVLRLGAVLAGLGAALSAVIGVACHLALRTSRAHRVDPLLLKVFDLPREAEPAREEDVVVGEARSPRRATSVAVPPAVPPRLAARVYAFLVGPVYVVCGAVESFRGTWWFGLLYASAGVTVMFTADTLLPRPDGGFTGRRRRHPLGRATGAPAVLFLLGAVAVAVRAVWLLANDVPLRFRL